MKIFKNKTVIGIACILLALMVCFLITPVYNKQIDGKTEVVQFASDVKRGQRITKEMVKKSKVGSYNLPEEYMKNPNNVIGTYAAENIYKDEYAVAKRLRDKPLATDEYLEELDGSKGAISVTVQSFAAGLSGKLFSGDVVSIIATDDQKTSIPIELKYVKVLACTLSDGDDVDENTRNEKDDENSTTEETKVADTVTLLADEEQSKLLANLEATQKLHIELVYRGDEGKCNKFLKEQDKILKEMKEDTVNE